MSPARPPASDAMVSAQPAPPVRLTLAGRRGQPPRHLADLDLAGRRAAMADLGEPPFRAAQLSRHFFGRYTERPDDMTDLPRASRATASYGWFRRRRTARVRRSAGGAAGPGPAGRGRPAAGRSSRPSGRCTGRRSAGTAGWPGTAAGRARRLRRGARPAAGQPGDAAAVRGRQPDGGRPGQAAPARRSHANQRARAPVREQTRDQDRAQP